MVRDSKAAAALIGSFTARLLLPLTNYAGNVWQKVNQEVTASAVSESHSCMVAQVPLFSSCGTHSTDTTIQNSAMYYHNSTIVLNN